MEKQKIIISASIRSIEEIRELLIDVEVLEKKYEVELKITYRQLQEVF